MSLNFESCEIFAFESCDFRIAGRFALALHAINDFRRVCVSMLMIGIDSNVYVNRCATARRRLGIRTCRAAACATLPDVWTLRCITLAAKMDYFDRPCHMVVDCTENSRCHSEMFKCGRPCQRLMWVNRSGITGAGLRAAAPLCDAGIAVDVAMFSPDVFPLPLPSTMDVTKLVTPPIARGT